MYSFRGKPYNKSIRMIESEFTKRMVILSKEASQHNKLLVVGGGNTETNIDIMTIPGLQGAGKSLGEEIAEYRYKEVNHMELTDRYLEDEGNRAFLFKDYMMNIALCRVDEIDKTTRNVRSYYATRSIKIASGITGEPIEQVKKYTTYLKTKYTDYLYKDMSILRVSSRKQGFVLSNPEAHIIFDDTKEVKITPVIFINHFADSLLTQLVEGLLEIEYRTETGSKGKVTSTVRKDIMQQVNSNEEISKKFKNSGYIEQESMMSIPDMEASKQSATGVQRVNVTMIEKVTKTNYISTEFRDVDLEGILPTFIISIEMMDPKELSKVYKEMGVGESEIYQEQKRMLSVYVNSNYSHSGEEYLKELHKYMVENAGIFENYTGKMV